MRRVAAHHGIQDAQGGDQGQQTDLSKGWVADRVRQLAMLNGGGNFYELTIVEPILFKKLWFSMVANNCYWIYYGNIW